jgi:hypothetical protein
MNIIERKLNDLTVLNLEGAIKYLRRLQLVVVESGLKFESIST